jgi:integrase
MAILIECPQCHNFRSYRQFEKGKSFCGRCETDLRKKGTKKQVRPDASFWNDFQVNGKAKREKVEGGIEEARRIEAERKTDVNRGAYCDPCITFRELSLDYFESERVKALKTYEDTMRKCKTVIEEFGDKRVSRITATMVENYQQRRIKQNSKRRKGEKISHAQVNRELAFMKAIFNLGIRNKKAVYNPVCDVEFLKENERDREVKEDELKLLLENISPRTEEYMRPIILTMYYTGMRPEECLRLQWSRIDFKEGFIRLQPEDTKTEEGRAIPMSEELQKVLQSLPKSSIFVFTRKGKPVKSIRVAWERLRKRIGAEDLWFRDFRPTAITNWVRKGYDQKLIMKASGHKTDSVFRKYRKVTEDDLKQLVEKKTSKDEVVTDFLRNLEKRTIKSKVSSIQ